MKGATKLEGGGGDPRTARVDRVFALFLIGVTAFRFGYAWLYPFGPAGDEVYYWDWGRRLAWGYYSKPPLIGWINGAVDALVGGSSVVTLRATSALIAAVSITGVYVLGRRLYGARAGLAAAALFVATIGATVGSMVLTIDAPLMATWIWALVLFARCREVEWRRPGPVAGLGLVVGLGLLAKQMMLVFWPLAALTLALERDERRALATRGFLGAVALSLALLTPNVVWNARHEWILVAHTSEHFAFGELEAGHVLSRVAEFLGGQALMISPITAWLGVVTWRRALGRRELGTKAMRMLVVFSLPAFGVFVVLAVFQRINANWPAVFHLALFVLVGGTLVASRQTRWLRVAIVTGALLAALPYVLPPMIAASSLRGGASDPTTRLRGWPELADSVDALRDHPALGRDACLVTTSHRDVASQLAFHLPDRPFVARFGGEGVVESQYGIWGFPAPSSCPRVGLIVDGDATAPPAPWETSLGRTERVGRIDIPLGATHSRTYTVFAAPTPDVWPELRSP